MTAAGGLSIVIPAWNEAARLGSTLEAVAAWAAGAGRPVEVIVVDDGSTDGTAALARARLASVPLAHQVLSGRANRGKGYSVREGARAATLGWTLITDADLSTPIAEADRLLAEAERSGSDVVVGSRALPESRIGVRQSWLRRNMGRTFNRVVRLLTGIDLPDTQCGFKLWRTERTRPVIAGLRVDGFAWDVEFLLAARRAGLRIGQVPVEWNNALGSKVGIVSDSLRMLLDIVRLRFGGGV